ncbi:MAG TPA: universal stress protein [Pyrinomonadaceae bacterium]|nr:universal stress protein [Pyrinomonadaceae bacterium]
MKLLFAYDGSACADAAIDDLARAGLPERGNAVVISVAEVWLPPPNGEPGGDATGIRLDRGTEERLKRHYEANRQKVAEAESMANAARDRLRNLLPQWEIDAEATYGSPAWEILSRADDLKPDLIVVGSQGRSAIGRFFLGSISQKVLTEARCSVRIARGRVEIEPMALRIVVGFDGSAGAQASVNAVAARSWPADTEVRLFAVTEPVTPSTIGRFIPPLVDFVEEVNVSEREWIEKLADKALDDLKTKGIAAGLFIYDGNPKNTLVEEAENWGADCIFVGANAFGSRLERFLLGSTSAAVGARAHCSVEVVRI